LLDRALRLGRIEVTKRQDIFPIVGVGASAGGIEALEGFFRGMPAQPGIAFIVVTHLAPDRESLLHEVIARYTDLTVAVAEDGAQVRENCVYVLPADAIISISDRRLQLRKSNATRRERKPIDILFSSLAIDQEECAASVVLSGGDGDGALGTKAIKEHGGLTMAQVSDGHGPQHASMPDSAISTGFVDFALPADQMGPKLAEFARMLAEGEDDPGPRANKSAARLEICAILRNQLGHDFSGYKSKTFFRRVQRRMQVTQSPSQQAYVEKLKADPQEVAALFRDLLINVTNFFRDGEAFAQLAEIVIPKLFEGRGADESVRVWVPGCATGEEVYSIAILLREHMDGLTAAPQVQVFATDIDDLALSVARAGRYPEALLDSVSPERRSRFFAQDGGSFVLTKEVRELCIFSPHSVIRDPPFSRLDLISCRNLLIYFGADIQNLVLPTFHYALREGGYLFLGLSESVGKFAELFSPVDKKHRIFRTRESVTIAPRVPVTIRQHPSLGLTARERRPRLDAPPNVALRQALESQVFENFAPAHLLVTREGDIVHFSARTNRYLEFAAGAPTRQMMSLARKGLRLDLRAAFREAIESGGRAIREAVTVTAEDGRLQLVDITAEPLIDGAGGESLYVVAFVDRGPSLTVEEAQRRLAAPDSAATLLLERELRETKERLQSLIEEYETALEELRSSNEELLSVNEELQSSNEELEASKEELQSLNEELNTVNAELHGKIEALDQANSDLQNIFESTQIPTVFLDRNLVIRSFTPAVKSLFNILPGDRGRPLTDLSSRLSLTGFTEDIRAVFDSGDIVEREISHEQAGTHFIMRVAPYRSLSQEIEGVVISFIDVTRLAQSQAHQKTLIAELNHRVKNMLMVAIGIAQQTHRSSPTPEAFIEAFIGRLQAMARSYELLSRENWTESALLDLLQTELAPFGLERLVIEGPDVKLPPKAALSFGMVLHELATNGAKYGALSRPGGKISIAWAVKAVEARPRLEFMWKEIGGPPLADKVEYGFGLKLIERETSYNLSGRADIDLASDGLVVGLNFPLDGPS
jgi:two-component system CheB/CheR fusion protein